MNVVDQFSAILGTSITVVLLLGGLVLLVSKKQRERLKAWWKLDKFRRRINWWKDLGPAGIYNCLPTENAVAFAVRDIFRMAFRAEALNPEVGTWINTAAGPRLVVAMTCGYAYNERDKVMDYTSWPSSPTRLAMTCRNSSGKRPKRPSSAWPVSCTSRPWATATAVCPRTR